jgi:hypothetical protein
MTAEAPPPEDPEHPDMIRVAVANITITVPSKTSHFFELFVISPPTFLSDSLRAESRIRSDELDSPFPNRKT